MRAGGSATTRDIAAERERGLEVLSRSATCATTGASTCSCSRLSTCGPRGGGPGVAIATVLYLQMRTATNDLFHAGQHSYGIPATGFLVETLLERGTRGDVAEAEAAIDRLAAARPTRGWWMRDAWLLRMRALLRVHAETRRRTTTIGIGTAREWPHRWLRGPHKVGRGDAVTAVSTGVTTCSKDHI